MKRFFTTFFVKEMSEKGELGLSQFQLGAIALWRMRSGYST